jgi:hypothetical protein
LNKTDQELSLGVLRGNTVDSRTISSGSSSGSAACVATESVRASNARNARPPSDAMSTRIVVNAGCT